ncbi:permease prefix domain 1-containing protein [Plantactinospora sp. WMMB782]|uniref:permease prefix domain 1-containing protein n=1 Tax=Plantactinospora sp. WMMB782 TaxID=3404121 RepID=UPI003B93B560
MTAPIDTYVSAVGDRLRGSARLRTDMLAEIRDALADAAEGYRHAGLTAPQAQRLAVREFGAAERIAAGLQDVLAVAQGRRTALLLVGVLGGQYGASELLGRLGGWQRFWDGAEPGAAYLWLARVTDTFAGLALGAALVAVVLLRWGPRHVEIPPAAIRLTAVLASVVVGVTMVCGGLLAVLPPEGGGVPALAGAVGSVASSALLLGSARQCWLAAAERPESPSPPRAAGSGSGPAGAGSHGWTIGRTLRR